LKLDVCLDEANGGLTTSDVKRDYLHLFPGLKLPVVKVAMDELAESLGAKTSTKTSEVSTESFSDLS